MLSYLHAYHAGNLADLHKHALLASTLRYMTEKPKPLTYLETHAGRGLYDLDDPAARQTGEAAAGVERALREKWLPEDHPLNTALARIRLWQGPRIYPGSPMIASEFLRRDDKIHLAELHPTEAEELARNMPHAHVHHKDGFEMARAMCPPLPRRGMMLIDPSYELKSDYTKVPSGVAAIRKRWNVGVIALWFPILSQPRHVEMLNQLRVQDPEALVSEVRFDAARDGHRMVGSGMWISHAPWGLGKSAVELESIFRKHLPRS